MKEIQTEIQNNQERTTDQWESSIPAALTPIEIATSTGRAIQLLYIYNPTTGVNRNSSNSIIYISWDGVNYTTIQRGTSFFWTGKGYGPNGDRVKLKSNDAGTKYELMMVS